MDRDDQRSTHAQHPRQLVEACFKVPEHDVVHRDGGVDAGAFTIGSLGRPGSQLNDPLANLRGASSRSHLAHRLRWVYADDMSGVADLIGRKGEAHAGSVAQDEHSLPGLKLCGRDSPLLLFGVAPRHE